jgi:hypothetical protein
VPASGQPLQYLKHVHGTYAKIRLPSRLTLNALVFPPVNYNRQKHGRYPVVITSIRYVAMDPYLSQYAEAVANAGGYFVLIDHPWSPKSMGQWRFYMENICSNVVTWPMIDADRIFLMSNSRQAEGLFRTLVEKPEICRGAILLAPPSANYPASAEFKKNQKVPAIHITTEDSAHQFYLNKFQKSAAQAGMLVELYVYPQTPHAFIAKKSQRDRIKHMLHFIFAE